MIGQKGIPALYGGILVFATLGAYSLHQSWVDLLTLYVFGLLGFVMRRFDIPVAPSVIGLILGHKFGGWVESTARILLWAVVFFALMMTSLTIADPCAR